MRNKKLWIFNGGLAFEGNPKYLFLYINENHKDIETWWFCYTEECKKFIKELGYNAVLFSEKKAEKIGEKAGVYVVDQNKENYPPYLLTDSGIDVLNLWHGVGCKKNETLVTEGFLVRRIVCKTIKYLNIYQNKQLFLVTSPLMENLFRTQLDLSAEKIIRAGYPRNIYNGKLKTFDHNILAIKGLSVDTKIAVYAPTYRDCGGNNFFVQMIPDMEKLIAVLEKSNYLLIIKVHPKMINEVGDIGYKILKQKYEKKSHLLFWNPQDDFYEIMNHIDLAIIDYSSILYDLLAAGVKKIVRYIFDYGKEGLLRDFALDYKEHSCGYICNDFDSLLNVFENDEKTLCSESELQKMNDLFWSYSKDTDTFETLINSMLNFDSSQNQPLPTLYSFDIFDTLIGRTVIDPKAIFLLVQEKAQQSDIKFPPQFLNNYIAIRSDSEGNCREYFDKSQLYRNSDKTEISFDMIFERMQDVYNLNDEQIAELKRLELESEYECSVPILENIEKLKVLFENGEKVVLVSDMYLPKDFIQKLLQKADPVLAKIPLFVSSDIGYQKTKEKLFLHVFHSVEYKFGKWIHYGDNKKADFDVPKKLGIEPELIPTLKMHKVGQDIVNATRTYDSHQIGKMISKFKYAEESHTPVEDMVYSLFSIYFVPYINWVLRTAISEGLDCLYFIARDGYLLKLAADTIIKTKNLNIKTKYIYGSRKVWRIASQIEKIDEELFTGFGEFAEVFKYDDIIRASHIEEKDLLEIIPSVEKLKNLEIIPKKEIDSIRLQLKVSEKYHALLLEQAKKDRELAVPYLKQEINFNEKFAFVEYWGRGYMQSCLTRLVHEANPSTTETECFYCRSIYPTQENNIRRNFTTNRISMVFIESFFDNIPYASVSNYKIEDGKIVPELISQTYNEELYEAFNKMIPRFAQDFASINFKDVSQIEKQLYNYGMNSYKAIKNRNSTVSQIMGNLRHSGGVFTSSTVYAPKITVRSVFKHFTGKHFETTDMNISLNNSSFIIRVLFKMYKKFRKLQARFIKK